MNIQLLGGPRDGLLVNDDGRPCWYVPIQEEMPLTLASVAELPDLTMKTGTYYRMYDMRSHTPRVVMVWEGLSWAKDR